MPKTFRYIASVEKFTAQCPRQGLYRVSYGLIVESIKDGDRSIPSFPACVSDVVLRPSSVEVILKKPNSANTQIFTGESGAHGEFDQLTEVLISGRNQLVIPLTAHRSSILIANTTNCDRGYYNAVMITARIPSDFSF